MHGGLVCTLLDSVSGFAVQTTLPKGQGCTPLEIKISYLRQVIADTGQLTAVGIVTKPGSRVAFAEGMMHDSRGKIHHHREQHITGLSGLIATGPCSAFVSKLAQ